MIRAVKVPCSGIMQGYEEIAGRDQAANYPMDNTKQGLHIMGEKRGLGNAV